MDKFSSIICRNFAEIEWIMGKRNWGRRRRETKKRLQ